MRQDRCDRLKYRGCVRGRTRLLNPIDEWLRGLADLIQAISNQLGIFIALDEGPEVAILQHIEAALDDVEPENDVVGGDAAVSGAIGKKGMLKAKEFRLGLVRHPSY